VDIVSTQDLITDGIILLFPILVAVALWILRLAEQRLPEKQREALQQFVKIAVQCVEATSTGTSTQKKNAALTLIYAFFDALHLPVPSHTLIDAAIESCVFEINQSRLSDAFVTSKHITGPIKPIQPGGLPV
jgi:LL-H family phage holin